MSDPAPDAPPGNFMAPVPPDVSEESLSTEALIGIALGLAGIGGIVFDLDWITRSILVLCAVAATIYAARRHNSHPALRFFGGLLVIALFVGFSWRSIWTDFHEKHPTFTWSEPPPESKPAPPLVADSSPQQAIPQDRTDDRSTASPSALPESPPPNSPQQPSSVPLPSAPTQSRLDRFIFDCNVAPPQTLEEDVRQKELLQKNIRAWADTFGVSVSFSEITNGIQVTIEAKTKEAKVRFISMGILAGVTKVIVEARWIDRRRVVVAHADVPKNYQYLSLVIPDPSAPQIIEGLKLIAQFLGAPEDACRLI